LKILRGSCWGIFNPGLKVEDSPGFLLGNLQSWIEDSTARALENLQSSIFNPGWKILQEEPWRIFNLQSWVEDSQV